MLGEFGDDPNRYTTAKCRKNYAGTSPLTVASGKKRAVLARHVRNRRLYDEIDQWAFCAYKPAPAPAPSTTTVAAPATCTTKPCAPSVTASSAASTAASATTPPTANTPPGHTAKSPKPLDNLRPWDVYTCDGTSSLRIYKQRLRLGHVGEARQMQLMRNGDGLRRPIPVLAQNQVSFTAAWVVTLERIGPVQKYDHIGILL